MHQRITTTAKTIMLTAGFIALGAGVSYADVETSGDGSVLSGNQVVAEGNAPINVTGNSVAALGAVSNAESTNSNAIVERGDSRDVTTSGDGSVGSGNQIVGEANAPINVSGNAVSGVLAVANAETTDSDAIVTQQDANDDDANGDNGDDDYPGYPGYDHDNNDNDNGNDGNGDNDNGNDANGDGGDIVTSGDGSVLSGNQAVGELNIPVNVSGNAGAILGAVSSAETTDSDAIVEQQSSEDEVEHQRGDVTTSGDGSVASGNQVVAEGNAPINATGNAIAGGLAVADAESTDSNAEVHRDGDRDVTTSGDGSVGSGNQGVVDANVPVNVSGNAGSALGAVSSAETTESDAVVHNSQEETEQQSTVAQDAPLEIDTDLQGPVDGVGDDVLADVEDGATELLDIE
ncbi:hypothetical protein RIF23_20280 [Lipingzhangella sp. LS1_29]|uniref:Chaplin domain-containing protein n=1 Tax=Lipingzhangella rawalii TaxID=2055835 RepID=A0ABU2HDI4_9ACTN|nr:hypothetical protein [Lipingzhangella rawalii]MDS1272629.1 hypothetical protein [Lipingzhangella rawalii]